MCSPPPEQPPSDPAIETSHFSTTPLIPHYTPPLPSYKTFFKTHLKPADPHPCILTLPLEPAFSTWSLPHPTPSNPSNRIPNYEYLREQYGDMKVKPCTPDSKESTEMPCSTFLNHMQNQQDSSSSSPPLYLRDWHFVLERSKLGKYDHDTKNIYTTPIYFSDDWLNTFLLTHDSNPTDDYRFVYIGPNGTSTPLHTDVLSTHSWSSNICGIKKWTFFHPSHLQILSPHFGTLLSSTLTPSSPDPIIIYQHPGEAIYVPSGWIHQVQNIGATISINHNWCNASNLGIMCKSLKDDLGLIQKEIGEYREEMGVEEWEDHCQTLLKANNAGVGWEWFWGFLEGVGKRYVALGERRLIDGGKQDESQRPWECEEIVKYSIEVILEVWRDLMRDEWVGKKVRNGVFSIGVLERLEKVARRLGTEII